MTRSVFAAQQFGVVKESLERGEGSEGGVVDCVEANVEAGHVEVAGGVVRQVQGGGEEDEVD